MHVDVSRDFAINDPTKLCVQDPRYKFCSVWVRVLDSQTFVDSRNYKPITKQPQFLLIPIVQLTVNIKKMLLHNYTVRNRSRGNKFLYNLCEMHSVISPIHVKLISQILI